MLNITANRPEKSTVFCRIIGKRQFLWNIADLQAVTGTTTCEQ